MGYSETSLDRGIPRTNSRSFTTARKGITELSRRATDSAAFRCGLRPILAKLIPFDAYCVNTADPATLLVTGSVGDGLPAEMATRIFEIEYLEPDFCKLRDLALRSSNVAVLGHETRNCPERSVRMRDVLLPLGYAHELRCALLVGGCCWGYLHLLRHRSRADFSIAEAKLIQCLSAEIALALRVSLLRGAPTDDECEAPGLVLFSSDCKGVESMNSAAERWVHELSGELCAPLPHSICSVVQRARRPREGASNAAIARLQTGKGRWLTVHGTRLGERVAVVLERAQPHDIAPIVFRAHDLSPREESVVQLLLRGMSNEEIAVDLKISVYTVKDHVKSIFRKTGVASRSELGACLFAGQYLPRIARREPLAASGWFAGTKI